MTTGQPQEKKPQLTSGWEQSLVDFARQINYQPNAEKPVDWRQPMPMAKEDLAFIGADQNQPGIDPSWDYKTAKLSPKGEPLPKGAVGWTPHGEPFYGGNSSLGEWYNGLNARLWQTDENGKDPNGWQLAWRSLKEVVKGFVQVLNEPTEQREMVQGGLEAAGEAVGLGATPWASWNAENVKKATEMGGIYAKVGPSSAALYKALDLPSLAWDVVRGTIGVLAGKGEAFEEGYQAGRIRYSTVIDEQVKAEYIRRMNNGENPYLLAEELQNPSAELFGELAGDPTMFLGFLGKTEKVLNFTSNATKYSSRPIEAIASIFGKKTVSEAAKMERIAEISEAGAGAVRRIAEAFDAKVAGTAFRDATKAAGSTSQGVSALGVLSKDSQRLFLSDITSTFTSLLAGTVRKMRGSAPWVDDVGEAIRAFWLMGSGKVDDFQQGARIASRYLPTNVAFSEHAMQYAALLRKMLPDERAALRLIDDIGKAENAGEIATKIGSRMLDFGKDYIPTMGQRVAALEKSAKGLALTAKEQALVAMGEVGAAGRAVARFEAASNSGIVKGLNRFFGVVYMGVSPGYAFRNLLNNTFTAFVDEGIGAALDIVRPGGAKVREAELAAIFGDSIPKNLIEGFGPVKSVKGAEDLAEGGGGFFKWLTSIGTRAAASGERNASVVLSHKGVVDTMNKGTTAMMRDLAGEMAERGFDAPMVERLLRINSYDVYKVRDILADAAKTGSVDLFQTGAWMSAAQEASLKEYDLYAMLVDGLGKIDPNDLTAKRSVIKDILAHAEGVAAKVVGEPPITRAADAVDHLAPDTLNAVRNHQQIANELAEQSWEGIIRRLMQKGGEPVRALLRDGEYAPLLNEQSAWQDALVAARDTVWEGRMALYNEFFPYKKPTTLRGAVNWSEAAARLGISDVAGIEDKNTLIARFWDEYFGWASRHYQTGRDEYIGLARKFYDEAVKIDGRLAEFVDGDLAKARQALRDAMNWDGAKVVDGAFVDAAGKPITYTPWSGAGEMPTLNRAFAEGIDGIRQLMGDLDEALVRTHGMKPKIDPRYANSLDWLTKTVGDRMTEVRFVASGVGKQTRDFAILNYTGKDNADTILSLIYPYQFWYRRTYANWMKRIAADPYLVSAYATYKDYMADIHAGLPDWWKYNINSNELLGIQSENPLFFNLEQTLNPLNGLTGIDFNDSNKAVDWWTRTLDQMNKFGPSTWTPISVATALSLYMRGEKDAAARWAGRLFPASATIEAAGNILGAKPFSADPFVKFFADGIDPYTERRVNRALAAMVEEGQISEDVAVDAASQRSGEVWNMAWDRAVGERSWGQLSSFFLGTGFKARTMSDIQIDNFYEDYNHFWNIRPNMSQEEFRNGMEQLRQAYPFMDTLLLGNKADKKRDGALAYLVLNRLPPGGSGMTEAVGIDSRLLSKFYDSKGDFSGWQQSEKDRFMAGIVDLRAILSTPADSTREEWNVARNDYSRMRSMVEQQFGEGIWGEVDAFYAEYATNKNVRPSERVSAALDLKSRLVTSNPLLATYYGGIETIGKYYQGLMWDDAEKQFGSDFWTRLRAGEVSSAEKKRYYALLDRWNERIDRQVLALAQYLPEKKGAQIRSDVGETTAFQQDFIQSLQPPVVSEADVVNEIGDTAYQIVQDFLNGGPPLPYTVRNKLQALADDMGIDYFVLLQQLQQVPVR